MTLKVQLGHALAAGGSHKKRLVYDADGLQKKAIVLPINIDTTSKSTTTGTTTALATTGTTTATTSATPAVIVVTSKSSTSSALASSTSSSASTTSSTSSIATTSSSTSASTTSTKPLSTASIVTSKATSATSSTSSSSSSSSSSTSTSSSSASPSASAVSSGTLSSTATTAIAIGASVGGVIVLILIVAFFLRRRSKSRNRRLEDRHFDEIGNADLHEREPEEKYDLNEFRAGGAGAGVGAGFYASKEMQSEISLNQPAMDPWSGGGSTAGYGPQQPSYPPMGYVGEGMYPSYPPVVVMPQQPQMDYYPPAQPQGQEFFAAMPMQQQQQQHVVDDQQQQQPQQLAPEMAGADVPGGAMDEQGLLMSVVRGFTPSLGDELAIQPFIPLLLHQTYDDGWCLCSNPANGERGVVPRDCLGPYQAHLVPAGSPQLQQQGSAPESHPQQSPAAAGRASYDRPPSSAGHHDEGAMSHSTSLRTLPEIPNSTLLTMPSSTSSSAPPPPSTSSGAYPPEKHGFNLPSGKPGFMNSVAASTPLPASPQSSPTKKPAYQPRPSFESTGSVSNMRTLTSTQPPMLGKLDIEDSGFGALSPFSDPTPAVPRSNTLTSLSNAERLERRSSLMDSARAASSFLDGNN